MVSLAQSCVQLLWCTCKGATFKNVTAFYVIFSVLCWQNHAVHKYAHNHATSTFSTCRKKIAPNTVLNHLQWFTTPFCHQGKLAWPNNCPATLFESMNKCQFSCQHMCSEIFWFCECQEAKQCHFCSYLLLNTNSWSATESKVKWMVWYLGKGELGQYFDYFTNHFIKIQKLYHVILIGFMIEGSETHVIHIKALFKIKKSKNSHHVKSEGEWKVCDLNKIDYWLLQMFDNFYSWYLMCFCCTYFSLLMDNLPVPWIEEISQILWGQWKNVLAWWGKEKMSCDHFMPDNTLVGSFWADQNNNHHRNERTQHC